MKVQFIAMRRDEAAPSLESAETLAVMPFIDHVAAQRSARQLAARAGADGLLLAVEDVERQGFIAIVNRVVRASASEFVAYVAQDCYAGRQWLARGVAALRRAGTGLLGFNDGKWSGALASFGLARRDWAAANYGGDLFWRGYERHFADAELTVLALNERRYAYDANCLMVEVDWDKERSGVNPADRALYRSRAAGGFDGRVADARLRGLFS